MPTANAIRLKRRRARCKAGRVVLPVEADEIDLIEMLIDAGLLAPQDAEDRQTVAHAAARFLDGAVCDHRKRKENLDE
ncbi:MAG: hypothetical protein AB7E84_06345 [Xanthobacteraceae bacterium]